MFYFFSRDKKNVCFKVGAKKKNCVLIFQKKNITESNNLGPPPPEIKWCVPKSVWVGRRNEKDDCEWTVWSVKVSHLQPRSFPQSRRSNFMVINDFSS